MRIPLLASWLQRQQESEEAMRAVYSPTDQEEIRRRSAYHFQNGKGALAAAMS